MRICLFGDFSGKPDEGMKNVSHNIKERLKMSHTILALNSRDILNKSFVNSIRSFKSDIIHYLHGPTIRSLIILKVARYISGNRPKTIVSATRPYFSKFSMWAVQLLKPDLILTQSTRFENFFRQKNFCVKFFPNGVSCQIFTPATKGEKYRLRKKLGLPVGKRIVLHIGHLKANRNLDIFKEIQKIVNIQVVIVSGTTENADETIEKGLLKSGIKVYRQFFENVSQFYKMADLYVFPVKDTDQHSPKYHNQIGAIDLPISIFEAMACNLPVITKSFGALPRIFRAGDGLLFCRNDADILNAVKNSSKGVLSNTREIVLPYDWDRLLKELEKIYRDIIIDGTTNPKIKFINIIGIDGSGKTTLCKKLLHEFQHRYMNMKYIHSYHVAFLLKPLKTLAKVVFMRKTDEFADYSYYWKRKTCASQRYTWLSSIYALLLISDYALQALCKVGIPKLLGRRLIVDRYVYDAILNASLTAHLSSNTTYRLVDVLLKILPKPDIVLLIDLPEEVAFSRKNDIQSIEYLRQRRYRYLEMADRYGFIKLNGAATPQKVCEDAISHWDV